MMETKETHIRFPDLFFCRTLFFGFPGVAKMTAVTVM